MGFWSTLLKLGTKAARGTGNALGATARTAGSATLHPQRTLAGAGTAMKSAAVGGAAGYVAWEKLTTNKSVARIVGDAVIGKEATDTIAGTAEGVRELKAKAGEAVDAVNGMEENTNSLTAGIGNFFRSMNGGNGGDMFSNFFNNIGKGNVSGMSLMGLVAAAFMIFGRFGWMSKIAGALLGMMIIGNNASLAKSISSPAASTGTQGQSTAQAEDQTASKGMRR